MRYKNNNEILKKKKNETGKKREIKEQRTKWTNMTYNKMIDLNSIVEGGL